VPAIEEILLCEKKLLALDFTKEEVACKIFGNGEIKKLKGTPTNNREKGNLKSSRVTRGGRVYGGEIPERASPFAG